MENLKKRGLLFELKAYSGWNTPTNSSGFVIGEGMLAKYMKDEAVDDLLLTRYLDDWAYQANVRGTIARQLTWLRGDGVYGSLDGKKRADGVYGSLDGKKQAVSDRSSRLMTRFVEENLPPFESLKEIEVNFPWNRLFESDIIHAKELYPMDYLKH